MLGKAGWSPCPWDVQDAQFGFLRVSNSRRERVPPKQPSPVTLGTAWATLCQQNSKKSIITLT